MKERVKQHFDSWIVHKFKNEGIRNYLLRNEHKEKCLNELCNQIQICERAQFSINFDVKKYKYVIENVANMYAKAALEKAKQDTLSNAEKQRRITEHHKMEQLEAEWEEDQKEARTDKIISYPTV